MIPLRVLVSIPVNVVFAEADRALIRNLVGITLATALLLIVAWYGTEIFVLRKVRALLEAARRVHAAGDLVLTEIAGLLKRHIRGSDMVCRLGGEEFVLILPGASLEGARQRAENIRNLVKNLDLKYHDQPLGTITASLGIALFPDHAAEGESLLHAADEALYEAKGAGRDRVIVSGSR